MLVEGPERKASDDWDVSLTSDPLGGRTSRAAEQPQVTSRQPRTCDGEGCGISPSSRPLGSTADSSSTDCLSAAAFPLTARPFPSASYPLDHTQCTYSCREWHIQDDVTRTRRQGPSTARNLYSFVSLTTCHNVGLMSRVTMWGLNNWQETSVPEGTSKPDGPYLTPTLEVFHDVRRPQ